MTLLSFHLLMRLIVWWFCYSCELRHDILAEQKSTFSFSLDTFLALSAHLRFIAFDWIQAWEEGWMGGWGWGFGVGGWGGL